jgi:hypothetical protein
VESPRSRTGVYLGSAWRPPDLAVLEPALRMTLRVVLPLYPGGEGPQRTYSTCQARRRRWAGSRLACLEPATHDRGGRCRSEASLPDRAAKTRRTPAGGEVPLDRPHAVAIGAQRLFIVGDQLRERRVKLECASEGGARPTARSCVRCRPAGCACLLGGVGSQVADHGVAEHFA